MHSFLLLIIEILAFVYTPLELFIALAMAPLLCADCKRTIEGLGIEHEHKPQPHPPDEFVYKYSNLPNKRKYIRLLNLFSSSPENPQVECQLVDVEVDLKVLTPSTIGRNYEALSWCWGTAQQTSYINIRKDGRIYWKGVQPELVAALKALRHPHRDRYLWIDAICINQQDVGEKNHQVEMMSTIYGQASRV